MLRMGNRQFVYCRIPMGEVHIRNMATNCKEVKQTNERTDELTNATKCFISLLSGAK